jgi:hypothetical protein
MIKPFCRHFFDLPLALLMIVRRDTRKVTCRTLREARNLNPNVPPVSDDEATRLLDEHGSSRPTALFPGRPIPGERLRPHLAGHVFEELGGVCFDLDGMLGKGEWTDRANWVFPLDREGRPQAPFNSFVATRETKARLPRLLETMGRNCALEIYTPFASCTFDTCSFSVALHRRFGLLGNLEPGVEVTYADVLGGAQKPFAGITVTPEVLELHATGYGAVEVHLVDGAGLTIADAEAEIYLEATGGYLPQKRAMTSQGKAQFRIGALGLEAGETFRVKVGFRHFSSVAEVNVRVV